MVYAAQTYKWPSNIIDKFTCLTFCYKIVIRADVSMQSDCQIYLHNMNYCTPTRYCISVNSIQKALANCLKKFFRVLKQTTKNENSCQKCVRGKHYFWFINQVKFNFKYCFYTRLKKIKPAINKFIKHLFTMFGL